MRPAILEAKVDLAPGGDNAVREGRMPRALVLVRVQPVEQIAQMRASQGAIRVGRYAKNPTRRGALIQHNLQDVEFGDRDQLAFGQTRHSARFPGGVDIARENFQ